MFSFFEMCMIVQHVRFRAIPAMVSCTARLAVVAIQWRMFEVRRRALEHRVNLMMSHHHSAAYARRLEKYASRGFAIALPGFDASLLSQDIRTSSYVLMKKRNLLLKVLCDQDAPGLSLVTMPAKTKVRNVHCRKQKAKPVS